MKTPLIHTMIRSPVSHACVVALLATLAGCAHPTRYSSAQFNIIPLSDVPPNVTAPTPIRTVEPEYPFLLRRLGIEGSAEVVCLVDETGAVRNVGYLNADYSEFAESAIAATQKWSFAPGTVNGTRAPLHVMIPFRFAFAPEGRAYADLERLRVR